MHNFEKLEVNLIPESIYMKEDVAQKTHIFLYLSIYLPTYLPTYLQYLT